MPTVHVRAGRAEGMWEGIVEGMVEGTNQTPLCYNHMLFVEA